MTEEEAFLLFFVGLFAIFFWIAMIMVGIALYILQAIGLFKMTKNEGRPELAWLAWIPIASNFLIMLIVENEVHKQLRGKMLIIYGISLVGSIVFVNFFNVFGFIPFFIFGYIVMFFIGFVPMIVFYYAFFFLVKKFSPNSILHTVIAVITFGAAIPIYIFIFRNRTLIPPQKPEEMVEHPEW